MSILLMSFLILALSNSGEAYADYTISMTSSGAQSIDIMPGSSGSNGTAIGTDSITVNTNCRAGYNLNIATSVNDNNLYLGGDSSNNTVGTYFTPADGTTALGSSVNKWGYYYNSAAPTTSPTKNNVFMAVPASGSPATVISPTASATDISDSFNIYYGVSVGSALTTGTYKMIPDTNSSNGSGGYNNGSIVYYLTVAEACMPYTVTFNPTSTAGGNTLSGTGTMNPQTIPAGVATALNTNTFTAPTGYEFGSWNTAQDGTGTSYTDGQSVTDLTTGGGSITLYAQWKKKITFQTATMADCGKTMTDDRGVTAYRNVAYTTAKIGDLCWMTRNLDLPGGATLTPSDSNVTSDYTLPASSTDGFEDDNTKAFVYNSDSTNFNDTSCGKNDSCYSYYSWAAATAGTNPSSGEASSDICPKGWRLPTRAEFNTLIGTYTTGATLTDSPFLGVYAGGSYYSSFGGGGSYGLYWSSTANDASHAYVLYFGSSFARIIDDIKYDGYSVRCVMKKYMQDQTQSSLAAMMANVGDTATLYDKRDEKSYTVTHLADGNYWMTTNLNLAGGTTISCDTSDCDNYTIPTTQGWQSGGKLPASSTSGFSSDNYAYVYNSNSTTCGNSSPCYSYYSWDAATLGSGRSISADNQNAPYSICPKGWRLPTTYNGSGIAAEATDFRALMIAFGGSNSVQTYNSSTSPTGATMSTTLQSTPNNFLLADSYHNGSFRSGGSRGYYWSATSYSSSTYARYLSFDSTDVYSANSYYRRDGFSVRCVYGG